MALDPRGAKGPLGVPLLTPYDSDSLRITLGKAKVAQKCLLELFLTIIYILTALC